MTEERARVQTGCAVKWAFAGAVEEIRRANLGDDFEAVECGRCKSWHIVRQGRRRAA